MHVFIPIGSCPSTESEPSAVLADTDRRYCRAFLNLLRRVIGPEPPTVSFVIRHEGCEQNPLRVMCLVDPADLAGIEYVRSCLASRPKYWDREALAELASMPSAIGQFEGPCV